jgi:hypothetical protein
MCDVTAVWCHIGTTSHSGRGYIDDVTLGWHHLDMNGKPCLFWRKNASKCIFLTIFNILMWKKTWFRRECFIWKKKNGQTVCSSREHSRQRMRRFPQALIIWGIVFVLLRKIIQIYWCFYSSPCAWISLEYIGKENIGKMYHSCPKGLLGCVIKPEKKTWNSWSYYLNNTSMEKCITDWQNVSLIGKIYHWLAKCITDWQNVSLIGKMYHIIAAPTCMTWMFHETWMKKNIGKMSLTTGNLAFALVFT